VPIPNLTLASRWGRPTPTAATFVSLSLIFVACLLRRSGQHVTCYEMDEGGKLRQGHHVPLRSPRSGLLDATQWDETSAGGAPWEEAMGWHAATAATQCEGSQDGK
jgi:hypothetical protein